ncbi:MAG TPA: VCBS domain-containing protein [Burkholderiales bacterium]|nr:VCBS domain-containing protein [Burkholderiales bacterium]
MTTLYERAQLAEASYSLLDRINYRDQAELITALDVANREDFEGEFSRTQATEFGQKWRVEDHIPDTAAGFSATLFQRIDASGATTGEYHLAVRGSTQAIKDFFLADLSDIFLDGISLDQLIDLYNYWKRVTTPASQTYTAARLVTLPVETALLSAAGPAATVYEAQLRQRPEIIIDKGVVGTTVKTVEFIDSSGLIDESLRNGAGIGPIPSIQLSGHSLGGHLAMAFTRLFPAVASSALAINGLGFRPSNSNVPNIFRLLGGASDFDSAAILNLYGLAGFEFAAQDSGVLTQVGGYEGIYIETGLASALGHSAVQMTDSLVVYELLMRLDSSLASATPKEVIQKLTPVLESATHVPGNAFERVVDALADLFRLQPIPLPRLALGNREALHKRAAQIRTAIDSVVAANPRIDVLPGKDPLTLQAFGVVDIAYRYALRELNTFAVLAPDLYLLHGSRGDLSLYDPVSGAGAITSQWLDDRASLAHAYFIRNSQPQKDVALLQGVGSIATEYRLYKEGQEDVFIAQPATHPLPFKRSGRRSVAQLHMVAFADDAGRAIVGSDNALGDHLYGGAGVDPLSGGAGEDRLEGGLGDDPLKGGDHADFLLGGSGDDALDGGSGADTYVWRRGDGFDTITDVREAGGVKLGDIEFLGKSLAGSKTQKFADNPYLFEDSDGVLYAFTGGAGVDGNLTIVKGGEQGGVTILGYRSGDFGILLPTPVVAQKTDQFGTADSDNGSSTEPGHARSLASEAPNQKVHGLGGNDHIVLAHEGAEGYGGTGRDYITNDGGDQRLFGEEDDDILIASEGNDYLDGGTGNDVLQGGGDDDVLVGADGNDFIDGGAGSDAISGGAGHDFIVAGGALNPFVTPGQLDEPTPPEFGVFEDGDTIGVAGIFGPFLLLDDGPNSIDAGDGNDYALGGIATDYIEGGAGSDHLFGFGGQDSIFGDEGDDILFGDVTQGTFTAGGTPVHAFAEDHRSDYLDGGAGNDSLFGDGGADELVGGAGNDVLVGDAADLDEPWHGADYLDGGTGDDRLIGNGKDDVLFGGAGNDKLDGDSSDTPFARHGADYLDGEEGDDDLTGSGGADTLFGGDGHDLLFGDTDGTPVAFQGSDYLDAGAGDDYVRAYGGDDTVYGGDGKDQILGERGDDDIDGEAGDDLIAGGEGNDTLAGGQGVDDLQGGAGNDDIAGGDDRDLLFGGEGDDALAGGAGDDQLAGNAGNDTLHGDAGNDIFFAGAGVDTVAGGDGADIALGAEGNDSIDGGAGDDALSGEDGDDLVEGNGGADILLGGVGQDTLAGGEGDDVVSGGHGDDVMSGDEGADFLVGDWGDDALAGDAGDDRLAGGDGNDQVSGGEGADLLWGEAGADALSGEAGADELQGGLGEDVLAGGEGVDRLFGDSGSDVLDGGEGGDYLEGGTGTDTLAGGDGFDVYFYRRGHGRDSIVDSQENALAFGSGITLADIRLGFGSLLLDLGGGDEIHLEGFVPEDPFNSSPISEFRFADGTTVTLEALLDQGFEVTGTPQADVLYGSALLDRIAALEDDDVVDAGAGDDEVDGGAGADVLIGGTGNDTYVIHDAADTVVELAGEGDDVIESFVSFRIADHVERLELQGSDDLSATGNSAANNLNGNLGNNELYGEEGDDTLAGFSGDDLLDGGVGGDMLFGGEGDDFYVVDSLDDVVVEAIDFYSRERIYDPFPNVVAYGELLASGGHDAVASSITYALDAWTEDLYLTGGDAIDGTGNVEANFIQGNDADNTLYAYRLNGQSDAYASAGVFVQQFTDARGPVDEMLHDYANAAIYRGRFPWFAPQQVEVEAGDGDELQGAGGNDRLYGHFGDDYLDGGAGDDLLYGFAGTDVMAGGLGNDTYVVSGDFDLVVAYLGGEHVRFQDDSTDELVELADEGIDTVVSEVSFELPDHIENLTLVLDTRDYDPDAQVSVRPFHRFAEYGVGNGLDNELRTLGLEVELFGEGGNDRLFGSDWSDYLDGGEGADHMEGGEGDDDYIVDDAGDLVIETGIGFDTVEAAISYALTDGVEDLWLVGFFGDEDLDGSGNALDNGIYGNDGANSLAGLAGSDYLDGGAGADAMDGGSGDDTYLVDDLGDVTAEGSGQGYDTVFSIVDHELGGNVEALYLIGDDHLYGFGNALDNLIVGNSGDNDLEGGEGADHLYGNESWDALYGGEGADFLDGGWEGDWMEGGLGDDTYVVDDEGDDVVELEGEGYDRVLETLFSYSIHEHVEEAVALGDYADFPEYAEIFGNALDNRIVGSDAENYLADFAGGSDSIDGRAGDDTIYGGDGDDALAGGEDAVRLDHVEMSFLKESEDRVYFVETSAEILAQNRDVLEGDGGNDALDGGSGDDLLLGGEGDDMLYGGDDGLTGDVVLIEWGEGEDGFDEDVGHTEEGRVFLTNDDELDGGEGDDILDGGSGNDFLFGGEGSDTLYGGDDGPLNTSNDDYLDGGAGLDAMAGGSGNDFYEVEGTFYETTDIEAYSDCGELIEGAVTRAWTYDAVLEVAGEGHDVVRAAAEIVLADHVEELWLQEYEEVQFGRGNGGDNSLVGNSFDNRLEGAAGNDVLYGEHGADVLDGGAGDDVLFGGEGDDRFLMQIGSGRDTVADAASGFDVVHWADHLGPEDLTFSRRDDDVVIGLDGTRDRIVLAGWFSASDRVQEIVFCDADAIGEAEIAALADARFVDAGDDYGSIAEDDAAPATGNVLANDSGNLASSLSVSRPGSYAALYGTLVIESDGSYAYTLDDAAVQWLAEGQSVEDAFAYEVEDEAQAFAEATLTLEIEGRNDAPLFQAGPATASMVEDATFIEDYEADGDSLVENGGFDDGFEGWTLSGNRSFAGVDDEEAVFGAEGSSTRLSQAIETEAGALYVLRFELHNRAEEGASFSVSWDGVTLLAIEDEDIGRESFEFLVEGGGPGLLEFSMRNDEGVWTLDEVELVPVVAAYESTIDDHFVEGELAFGDADEEDGHDVTFAYLGEDELGWFDAFLAEDASGAAAGSIAWSFEVENDAIAFLDEGEARNESYEVTVADAAGVSATQTVTIEVRGANDAPLVEYDAYEAQEDVATLVTGNVLENDFDYDERDVLSVVAPGTFIGEWGILELAADGSFVYTLDNDAVQFFAEDELWGESFEYEVTDGSVSEYSELVIDIRGANDAPAAEADAATVAEDGTLRATGNVLANDSDLDFNQLAVVDSGTFLGAYGTLVLESDGSYEYILDNGLLAVQALRPGEVLVDSFAYEAHDGYEGVPGILEVTIEGANDAPEALDDAATVREDLAPVVSGTVLANDADSDAGGTVRVAHPGAVAGAFGRLFLLGDGRYTYVANNDAIQFLGQGDALQESFAYAIDDEGADPLEAGATLAITLLGNNDAPTAGDDAATVREDGLATASGNVLLNDQDVDQGATLVLASVGTYQGTYGSLTLQADGNWRYDLANGSAAVQGLGEGESGLETFVYELSDGLASGFGEVLVTVEGENDTPLTVADLGSVTEDTALVATGNLLANDSDADGSDTLSLTPGAYAGAYGTLFLESDGAYRYELNNALNAVQGLAAGEEAVEVFTYDATDGIASAAGTLRIVVTGSNDAPVAPPDGANVAEDGLLEAHGNVLENDSDVDGADALAAIVPGTYAGAYGSLTLGADGSYTYTLENAADSVQGLHAGEVVTDSFVYSADDGTAHTPSTVTIAIAGANDVPVAVADKASALEDGPATVAGNLLANDTDRDFGTVLVLATPGTYTGLYGTLVLGAGGSYAYTLDNAAAVVQGLRAGQVVFDTFGYRSTDGLAEAESTFTVEIAGANDAPVVASPIADREAAAGTPFVFTVPAGAFADADHLDTLSYAATLADGSALPEWLAFDGATRTFAGTPPGSGGGDDCGCGGEETPAQSLAIRIVATDAVGASAFDDFNLNVAGGAGGGDTGELVVGTDKGDVLAGTACDDVIDGREGFDKMTGGEGNDIYFVDETCGPDGDRDRHRHTRGKGHHEHGNGHGYGHHDDHCADECRVDLVIERPGEGQDVVYSIADYALADNVEELHLLGCEDLDATGNGLANVLAGNEGDNMLSGRAGSDTYVYARGGGDDVVDDKGASGELDTLKLEGFSAGSVRLKRSKDDLVVEFAGREGSVTLKKWFASSASRVERFQFDDGTTWDEASIRSRVGKGGKPSKDDYGHHGGSSHDGHHGSTHGHGHRDRDDGHRRRRDHDDGDRRDGVDEALRDRLKQPVRFDFEEVTRALGSSGSGGRTMTAAEIAKRWAQVQGYTQCLEDCRDPDNDADIAALRRLFGESSGHGHCFGFEGSTGASHGPDKWLKTLEGLCEGFRRL